MVRATVALAAAALSVLNALVLPEANARQSPAKDKVMITPRAVLIDEEHYQATFTMNCTNNTCRRVVVVPIGFDRLIVHRISCDIRAPTNAKFLNATFGIVSPTNEPLILTFSGVNAEAAEGGIFILNYYYGGPGLYLTRPNHGEFLFLLTHAANDGACTLIGVVRTLASGARSEKGVRESIASEAGSGDE